MKLDINNLMSAQSIIDKATPCHLSKPQIYFLIDGDEIVYVGSTSQFGSRLLNHLNSRKIFTSYTAIDCTRDDMQRLEYSYIDKFKPKYNQATRPEIRYAPVERVKKPFGVTSKRFAEFIKNNDILKNEQGWVNKASVRAKWIEVHGSWLIIHKYPPIDRNSVYYEEFVQTGKVKAFRELY